MYNGLVCSQWPVGVFELMEIRWQLWDLTEKANCREPWNMNAQSDACS